MNMSFKVDEKAILRLEKYVKEMTTYFKESVASDTYNYIITHNYPYWSGSYISSWNIKAGSPDLNWNKPVYNKYGGQSKRGIYPRPSYYLQGIGSSFSEPVYISNNADHALLVENEGTLSSNFEPWNIASHAYNQTLMSYKV